MGNRKITELTALTAPVADDLLTIVDISEGLNVNKNKKITYSELFKSVIDGTAAAPSIAFDSSATTGLYRSATNELSIATGGTQRIKVEASGATTIFGNLTVQGTQTTVSSTTLEVTDKNIELAKGAGNDTAADGGGITLDSTDGDKLFKWLNSTDSWTSSEHLEVASGKTFRINGNNVLSQTTLGSTVVSSSLTSVGNLVGLTINGDLTLTGASANAVWDASDDALEFADNAKAAFGTGSDLKIYHDGTQSIIKNTTGNLDIITGSTSIDIQGVDGSETLAKFIPNGAVELYYNNSKKFETSNTGASLTGTLVVDNLDVGTDVDVDGTLEADAYTVNGTALNEYIADTVGAMVSSNTETNITVTYDDSDNTLDFVIGTLNQNTTGNAATATALETARTIGGVSFNGTANINLPGVNQTGNQNTTGSAATLTTARTIGGVSFDGSANINLPGVNAAGNQNTSGTAAGLSGTPDITVDDIIAASLDISGNADIDGTLEADAYTVNGTALNEYIADTVGAMVSSNTETNISVTYQDSDNTLDFTVTNITGNAATATALETARTIGGVSFDGTGNITLPGVNATGNQNTTGSAATLTTARTIGGVSFDGSANITLPGVNSVGNQNTTGSAATLTTARTIGGVSFDGSANITLPGVNSAGNQNTSGTSAGLTGTPNITVADVVAASLDISGNADIDGTLEADAITVDGTALNEFIADTVGAMVSSNTETNITVTYEDSDNTLDFVIGTLNQNTTGSAATLTTARTIGGVSFDGSANINLPGVNTAGNQNTSGTAANLSGTPNITVGDVVAASLDISGNVDVDGTLETDALTINGTSLSETIADTVGAMVTSNTETGITVTYDDADNTLDFVVGTLNQNTTGNAATATALQNARTINGVSFDGTGNITVTAAAGTLTGSTLTSGVTASSLTSVGTLTGLTTSGNILMTGTGCIDVAAGTSAQRPGSPNAGMFRFNTTDGKFEGHDGSAWGEIGGSGGGGASFYINTLSSSSNTGGGSATFNGTAYRFTISNAPATGNAAQMLVSVGGVIQKANSGTSQPSEGYAIDGNDIIFGAAPASAASWFIITYGALNAGTPTDNTVTTLKLVDNAVTGAKIADNLDIPDNNKIRFGTGNDLSIYHNGSKSIISDTGTGALELQSNLVNINNAANTENIASFAEDGAVKLYYDNSLKFETTSSGATISGDLTVTSTSPGIWFTDTNSDPDWRILNLDGTLGVYDTNASRYALQFESDADVLIPTDTGKLKFGASQDLEIFHNGSHSFIKDVGTGNLAICGSIVAVHASDATENMILCSENGAVELYHDNSKKFETTSVGAEVHGRLLIQGTGSDTIFNYNDGYNYIAQADDKVTYFRNRSGTNRSRIDASGHYRTEDNIKLVCGTGQDMAIYHDGTDSHLYNQTGTLKIRGSDVRLMHQAGNEITIRGVANGAAELYFDNSKKFETTSSGAKVTGTLEVTEDYVTTMASGYDFWIDRSGNKVQCGDNISFRCGNAGDLQLYHDGSHSYIANTTGNLYITEDGYIELSSANGGEKYATFTKNGSVELYHNNDLTLQTIAQGIVVKDPTDASVYIDMQDSGGRCGYIYGGTGNSELGFLGSDSNWMIKGITDGAVELFYDASKKFETTSSSVKVYGHVDVQSTGSVYLQDNGQVQLGTGQDFRIYHSGSHAYIDNHTGNLYIRANCTSDVGGDIHIRAKSGENSISCLDDGSVELYFDNNKKLNTRSNGIDVTGDIYPTGHIALQDDYKLICGGGDDLKIFHAPSDDASKVINQTGHLHLYAEHAITLNKCNTSGAYVETYAKFLENGGVELYYDGVKKVETTSAGFFFDGTGGDTYWLGDSLKWRYTDSVKGCYGTSDDLQIYHSGSHSYIENSTNNLIIGSSITLFKNAAKNENLAQFTQNGACDLYYDSAKKFETDSSGCKFHGRIIPTQNNAYVCGNSSYKWSEIYAQNGSIQTSDRNEKRTIRLSDLGLDFINQLKPVSYKWKESSRDTTRYGLIAQDVEEVLTGLGKSLEAFDGVRKDNGKYGLNYAELISPLIKAVQELSEKVAALEAA